MEIRVSVVTTQETARRVVKGGSGAFGGGACGRIRRKTPFRWMMVIWFSFIFLWFLNTTSKKNKLKHTPTKKKIEGSS